MVPWRFMGRAFAVPLPKIEPYFARPGLPAQIRECGFQTCLCRRGFLIPEELRRIKSLEALPFALPRAVSLQLPPPNRSKKVEINCPSRSHQTNTIHAFCRQATLAYLIYRHFYSPAREIRSTTLLPSCLRSFLQ